MSTRSRWSLLYAGGTVLAILVLMVASHATQSQAQVRSPSQTNIQNYNPGKPKDWIVQYASRQQAGTQSVETNQLIRVNTARTQFAVDGAGLTIAVMDTGLRMSHVDFAAPGKIPAWRNFTNDDGGNPLVVTDVDGHGTNVAGIAVADGIHTGVAPKARVIPLKVLDNTGNGQFQWMVNALDWVISNRTFYNIRVVNMSIGAGLNLQSDTQLPGGVISALRQRIQTLRNLGVPVCIAAGNSFWELGSQEGMDFPAIVRESVSVGAVFDADVGEWPFSGLSNLPGFPNALPFPAAFTSGPRRLAPFSQRLSAAVNPQTKTDVFAPGSVLTSTGNLNDLASSDSSGTSQATPVVAGMCLLLQQYYFKRTGTYPTVAQLEQWLSTTSTSTGNLVFDGDDEDDNVTNTNRQFPMLDAIEALNAIKKSLAPPSPPPSAVTAVLTGPSNARVLTLTGDANGSNLTISAQGSKVTLSGSSTTINGKSSVSYTISGAFTLAGNMNAGDDNLSLISLPLSNLTLNLGAGADKVVMNYCTVTNSALDGGPDIDTVISTTSSIITNNNTNIP